ncbi:putative mitochondrial -like protein [Trichinella pseudospiralis]|uniref:Putative mitochondrial-like protein n=1 Tax=Trichinella pseudospiralis TaxID=6337 RepID=A0A0V1EJM4_TRIPS|nr:putative mitochondrial -like protein [Trichinella pseudospiralis]
MDHHQQALYTSQLHAADDNIPPESTEKRVAVPTAVWPCDIFKRRPRKQKVIACQSVCKTWFIADGSFKPRKARLVANKFLQRPNVDFRKRYAPVTRLSFIRNIMSISANYGLTAHKLDFVFANVPEVQYGEAKRCRIKKAHNIPTETIRTSMRFTLRRGTEMTVAAICSDDVIIALNNIGSLY